MRKTHNSNSNPYRLLPAYTRWAKCVAGTPYGEVDPVAHFPFKISPSDKVATAGSCFAQHIARHLKKNGFEYFVAEEGHPILHFDDSVIARYNYGTFSARYGNIYTARQLLQLFKRAYGTFVPKESFWRDSKDNFIDPFRPAIQPGGFASQLELEADRKQHLSAVRTLFEKSDVFIFTLGLTEYWSCKEDGAVLPICPGINGGIFDESVYEFGNSTVFDVIADLEEFFALLKEVNQRVNVILTVSPVPLAATGENRSVLTSTVYSKSVLRVAAEHLATKFAYVGYFPSYEIVIGNHSRGRYFAENLRDVTEEGVEHVMRLFMRHVASHEASIGGLVENSSDKGSDRELYQKLQTVVATVCEESLLEASFEIRPDEE